MNKYFFSHGRSALLNGLKLMNFSRNDCILIPDYLCEIVELTLKSANLKFIKYEINDDFSINLKSLKSKIKLKNIKAVLFVNYFGFPQKIVELKKLCKRYKLKIIEDNSHGYGGLLNNEILGSRGNFGFSSPRKVFKVNSGGILYYENKVTFNLPKYKYTINNTLTNLLNKNFKLKTFIKKNLIFKKDFTVPMVNRDTVVYNMNIDDSSLKKLRKQNIIKEKNKRYVNYLIWKKYLLKYNFKPIFKEVDKNLMIWCLPFYVKNSKDAKNWFLWGYKKGITIFSWPDLSIENIKKNNNCFKRWKRLVCLPLDMPSSFLKKTCN